MAKILALSSFVASGHVGLSAVVPIYQRFGHEVVALPTVLLSNHPGHAACAAHPVEPVLLLQMLDALAACGQLNDVDAVSTGYLPSVAHVDVAVAAIERVKTLRPEALIHCDPIIGDDPDGAYIDIEAAHAIKTKLISQADILTPNAFELRWLTNLSVDDAADSVRASRELSATAIIAATSIPDGPNGLANVLTAPDLAIASRAERLDGAPHGTGDVFAALLISHILSGAAYPNALSRAAAGVGVAIRNSIGQLDLSLIAAIRAPSDRMTAPIWIAGVDGCRGGWVAVGWRFRTRSTRRNSRGPNFFVLRRFDQRP